LAIEVEKKLRVVGVIGLKDKVRNDAEEIINIF
jgi:magnesium-transporting ATPase (P-type)